MTSDTSTPKTYRGWDILNRGHGEEENRRRLNNCRVDKDRREKGVKVTDPKKRSTDNTDVKCSPVSLPTDKGHTVEVDPGDLRKEQTKRGNY